ncbi:pre-mRNA-splicing factor CWC24 [Rhizoctonia solani]|uniref:Pre-mRNA-splicing factor CWC24 n=1 Tax=Rhizoctonia solani TaxID=456999 RepID=A0A8H8PB09_9AGAM|nr:pre-mRNA-splicing factor CWC24 [Rhizoctonia solani]QRW26961.1 pre-mRNA-splicing factor CWC24 [Rhizoctonia solani]
MAETEQPNVPFFKKKARARPTTARQRSASPSSEANNANAGPSKTQVVLPKSDKLLIHWYKAPKRAPGGGISREEAELELEIMDGEEAAEVLRKAARDAGKEDLPDDGMYRGQASYKTHIKKRTDGEPPKAMRVGPQRGSNTIKTVTLVDYQPDVCKDYKETGYCGFGDTCKFLHDRGTYMQGWQLDKMYENTQNQTGGGGDDDSDSSDEDIPFACYICKKEYTDPVVTRCGHYFCSACAIKRFAKTPKCMACGAPAAAKEAAGDSDKEDGPKIAIGSDDEAGSD